MSFSARCLMAGVAWLALVAGAQADDRPDAVDAVVVTATRIPVDEQRLPAMLTRISGQDLANRGAEDLRTTLALVSGAEAPPGGDAGPASAVPSFWGLHEFDAFLLVVDGVPWGGAFNPAISTLDLNNVDRVEVLKGPSPVALGQNAFVGVIQVIHNPAGEASPNLSLSGGERGSYEGSLVVNLPRLGDVKQTLSVSGEHQGFADAIEKVRDFKVQYRAATPLAGGDLRASLDLALRRDKPQSPVVLMDGRLTDQTPLNANYNPADGRIDNDSVHGTLAYDHPTPLGIWTTLVSAAYTQITDIRGFLRPDLTDTGDANADSQNQRRRILDGYLDTHLSFEGPLGAKVLVGTDVLAGVGRQISRNGEYYVPLSGKVRAPSTATLHVDEINTIDDTRVFAGQYVQADWTSGALNLLAGLRVNEMSEHKRSGHVDTLDPTASEAAGDHRAGARLSGNLGASWRLWQSGPDHLVIYSDLRRTSQAGAVDFGPDYTPDVLKVERANIYEVGAKGVALNGRVEYEVSAFRLDDHNLEIATTDANGNPIIQNAGSERLQGVEAEARYHAAPALDLFLSASWHDATFTHYIASEGGANIDVSGNSLTLSPTWLVGAGLVYAPAQGLGGSLVMNLADKRWLNLTNTAQAPAYATVDAGLTWKTGRHTLFLRGTNLTDRRDAATASEFGDQSFYRVSGRKVMAGLSVAF